MVRDKKVTLVECELIENDSLFEFNHKQRGYEYLHLNRGNL